MPIIMIFISFLLEGIFTNFVSFNSLFIPLFTVTSFVILFPYFSNKDNYLKYLIVSTIFGLLYDIVYTNSPFINVFAFLLNALMIILINHYINSGFLIKIGMNIAVIIFYRFITYFLLCIFGYLRFNENILLKGIYSSLIVNIIYSIILYFGCDIISKKLNIRKYE